MNVTVTANIDCICINYSRTESLFSDAHSGFNAEDHFLNQKVRRRFVSRNAHSSFFSMSSLHDFKATLNNGEEIRFNFEKLLFAVITRMF